MLCLILWFTNNQRRNYLDIEINRRL